MKAKIPRRSFLTAAGVTVASVAAAAADEKPPAKPRVTAAGEEIGTRVNVASLDDDSKVLASYRKAVAAMKRLDARDPVSWTFQANMHGAARAEGANDGWRWCMHQNWWFLPWHRGYLYYFERIIRKHSGDDTFCLPYWAWEQPQQAMLPVPFRAAHVNGEVNPLHDGTRFGGVNEGRPLRAPGMQGNFADGWKRAERTAEFTTRFSATAFGGLQAKRTELADRPTTAGSFGVMESQAHNLIHVAMGGNMTDPITAARDPIFWLHHANVDRLWNRWLDINGHYNPEEADWKQQGFPYYDETGKRVVVTVQQILDNAGAQYLYDDDRRIVFGAGPKKEIPVERTTTVVAAAAPQLSLGATPFAKELKLEEGGRPRLVGAIKAPPSAAPPVVALRVEDIEPPAKPDVLYEVFVVKTGMKPADKYSLGTITFFGVGGEHDHGVKKFTQAFDATEVLERLRRENNGELPPLDVRIVPHSADPGVSDTDLAKKDIKVPISNVTLTVIEVQKEK